MLFIVCGADILLFVNLVTSQEVNQNNANQLYFKIALLCIGAYLVGMGLLMIKHGIITNMSRSTGQLWREIWTIKFHTEALSNKLQFALKRSKIYTEGAKVRFLGLLLIVIGMIMIYYGK